MIAIVLVLVMVFVVGGGWFLWWAFWANRAAEAARSIPTPTINFPSPPSYTPPTYSPPVTVPTYTPPPTRTTRVFDPRPGDCVRNSGTYTRPILHESSCTSGHYRIIHRYEKTNDRRLCNVGTYAVWYTDPVFLLCMRKI